MNIHPLLRLCFALLFLASAISATAGKRPPMLEARENLERAVTLLQQPNVKKEKKHENAVANQLNRALLNLEEVKENKGSQLPLAIKDVKAAQAELTTGDDEVHRAKALELVQSALKHVDKGWDNRGNH
jgi:hypothetical protein